jgi:hypothetical protein
MSNPLVWIDPQCDIRKFKLIKPENYPNYEKSAFELGYTEYIKRVLITVLNPKTSNTKYGFIDHIHIISKYQLVSLELGKITPYCL